MSSKERCEIIANPDVTGLGIRASIYALSLAGPVIGGILQLTASEAIAFEFLRSVEAALGLQGVALLCTTLLQTGKGQLSLFHAMCVVHLLAFSGISIFSNRTYYGRGIARIIAANILFVLATLAFIVFNFYLWLKAPTFGSQPECNATTVYVVFGVSINATAPVFRYLILATIAITSLAFISTILIGAFILCSLRRRARVTSQVLEEETVDSKDSGLRRLIVTLVSVCFYIYAIVTLEQIIARNNVGKREREWTFGQVIALFLLLGTANELLTLLASRLDDVRNRENRPSREMTDSANVTNG